MRSFMKIGDIVDVSYKGIKDPTEIKIVGYVRKVSFNENKGTLVCVKLKDGSGYRSFYLEKAKYANIIG